jgi:hypothetical protein
MNTSPEHDQRMANMTFAKVYQMYVAKIQRKGRDIEELNSVIQLLTGFHLVKQQELIDQNVSFKEFFEQANLHPNANNIKGTICGYRIQEIQNPLTQKVRYLDKLVDDLAKGKSIQKIKELLDK